MYIDMRGGAGDCVERLSLERDASLSVTRQSLLRRLAGVRELRSGDYAVFAAGPGGPPVFFDHRVPVPVSLRAGFVSWRQGDKTVNVVSHTAAPRYMQAVLDCADFTPRGRVPGGVVWRPGRARSFVIEGRGILVTGRDLPLLRRVAEAVDTAQPGQPPADWQALRRASGQAAALVRSASSCEDYHVLSTLSTRQVELSVALPTGQRLRGVRAPRGVRLGATRQSSGGMATRRANVPNAERAVTVFAGVPPDPRQPWRVSCGR
ncbi:MAG: hypothetical protein Q8O56_07960 [Solirubrobacteraceae bacterium]|nr:hypothetical protein [Solirubrobacteraceae bacterium]